MSNHVFAFYFKNDLNKKIPNYAVRMFSSKLDETVIEKFCSKALCQRDEVVVKILKRGVVYTHKSLSRLEDVLGKEFPDTGDNLPLYTMSVSMYTIPSETFLSFTSVVSHDKDSLVQMAKKHDVKNAVVEVYGDVHRVNYGDFFEESIVLDGEEIHTTECEFEDNTTQKTDHCLYVSTKPVCTRKELCDLSNEDILFLKKFQKTTPKTVSGCVIDYQKQMSSCTNSLFTRQKSCQGEQTPSFRKLKVYDPVTKRWVRASCATGVALRNKARDWGFPCELHDTETGKIYYD